MRAMFLALAPIILAACVTSLPNAPTCAPLTGVEALWADPQTHYVVLGEYHGTTEMPAATADIVCHAGTGGARVLLALELPQAEEEAVQALVAGELDATAVLRIREFWRRSRDGRNSMAMFAMLQRVKDLRREGLSVDVIAVAPSQALDEERERLLFERFTLPPEVDRQGSLYDLRMAAAVIDGARRTGAQRVIFLVGDAHAVPAPSPSSSINRATGQVRHFVRMHAAAALPRESTLSLQFTHAGGETFAQARDGSGVRALTANEQGLATPAVVVAPHPEQGPAYDGRVFVGQISASPPVILPDN